MDQATLNRALQLTPFLQTIGLRVEDFRPGEVVIRLPTQANSSSPDGQIHTGPIFTAAETAAQLAISTHPLLGRATLRMKAGLVTWQGTSARDLTAQARVLPEHEALCQEAEARESSLTLTLPVQVLDGKGQTIASLEFRFALSFGGS
jgi:acyl-coenzyme A thioesterase PaaI-like protein